MSRNAAENCYRKGMAQLTREEYLEGLAYFEAAIRLERAAGCSPTPRYYSYYGLCLARATAHKRAALETCQRALEREFYNPEMYLNLGSVFLWEGRRQEAHRIFRSGLSLQSDHPGLLNKVLSMGLRRPPAIRFLDRSNPVNRFLGRFSHRPSARP